MVTQRSQRGHATHFVLVITTLLSATVLWGWSRIADEQAGRALTLQRTQLTWLARSAARLAGVGETKTTLAGREAIVQVVAAKPGKPGEQRLQAVATVADWGVATVVVGTTAGKVSSWEESFERAP